MQRGCTMLGLALSVLVLASQAAAYKPDCSGVQCKTLTADDCPAGIGSNVAECCDFCLRGEGEPCTEVGQCGYHGDTRLRCFAGASISICGPEEMPQTMIEELEKKQRESSMPQE